MTETSPLTPQSRIARPSHPRDRLWVTSEPGSGGELRATPEAFRVREVLAYAPQGVGDHAFVRVRKVGLDTLEVLRRLARALDRHPRDPSMGFSGLKDRQAIAEQWFSVPWSDDLTSKLAKEDSNQLQILEITRHPHKLRRGHARANQFTIEIARVPPGGVERACAVIEALRAVGVPNAFGPQRFGREGTNADRARDWICGRAKPPRDRRFRDLLASALQSEVFNAVLAQRIALGLFDRFLVGDIAKKHETGGLFEVEDVEIENRRAAAVEISPTGPLPGRKMRLPTREALALEREVLAELELTERAIESLGPGTRRPIRYPLCACSVVPLRDDAYLLEVTLPSGSYATVLLDEIVKPEEALFSRTPEADASDVD